MSFRNIILAVSIILFRLNFVLALVSPEAVTNADNQYVDLLQRYPTTLSAGCTEPGKARQWEFTEDDIFFLSEFSFKVSNDLEIRIGSADLGMGHSIDGAVFAIVIPKNHSSLKSSSLNGAENIDHVWLRFHPAEINRLFPENTVKTAKDKSLLARMQEIADTKIYGSWQAGGLAMIPGRKYLTVDADTTTGKRRFFAVDTKVGTARYISTFENLTVPKDKPLTKALARESFDLICEEYDRNYAMFILRPEIDWEKLCEKYHPIAINSKTRKEFALVCAELLKNLRDLHIWVKIDGQHVPVYNRPRQYNANQAAIPLIIGELDKAGEKVRWAITSEKVGYITIDSWSGDVDKKIDEVLENMRDTRGLIIDVRQNGGGSEPLAKNVAGRFADKEYIYAYSQYRNGSKHTDLTEKYPRKIKPGKLWRYDRPVVLLIGQRCMSSNESFISMMAEFPQVTTTGDRTCGSSGNPKFLDLPAGVRISLPKWIDFLPDGTPLDEKGVQPDKYFPFEPEFFEGNRDDLLKSALEQVQQLPLPVTPIPGKSIHDVIAEGDEGKPRVVSVWPPDGAKDVEPKTEIRIRFDRPMDPLTVELRWNQGKCIKHKGFEYNKYDNEFVFEVILDEGSQHIISVNSQSDFLGGFRSLDDNKLAKKFQWNFETKKKNKLLCANKPEILHVDPLQGSELPLLAVLKIKFDVPMDYDGSIIYCTSRQKKWFDYNILGNHLDYDSERNTFSIPVVLKPNWNGVIEMTGFVSSEGKKAETIKLEYSSGNKPFPQHLSDRLIKAGMSEKLLNIMGNIKEMRSKLKSLSETVISVTSSNDRIEAYHYLFKMKGNRCFYADISSLLNNTFLVGSNGKECWWYFAHKNKYAEDSEKFILLPYDDVKAKNISICNSFDLFRLDVQSAIKEYRPEYIGTAFFQDKKCYLIRTWSIEENGGFSFGSIKEWWIDAENLKVLKIESSYGSSKTTYIFLYDQNLPEISDFRYPGNIKTSPQKPKPLCKDYDTRLIKIIDGSSNGIISVRWGRKGPEGVFADGMN